MLRDNVLLLSRVSGREKPEGETFPATAFRSEVWLPRTRNTIEAIARDGTVTTTGHTGFELHLRHLNMNYNDLHSRAEYIARRNGISHSAALSMLGHAGACKANKIKNQMKPLPERDLKAIESPERPFWWQKESQ